MRMLSIFVFGLFLFLTSCTKPETIHQIPLSLEEELVGKWMMHKVYIQGNDITKQHNPDRSRWVNFSKNGQFASGGSPFELSYGKWKLNKGASTLHMVSEDNENSNWQISINGNELEWKGIGTEGQGDFKLVLKRKEWKNS